MYQKSIKIKHKNIKQYDYKNIILYKYNIIKLK